MWEHVRASSRCNLIEKVLLKIACSGNDYRGAYYGNRMFCRSFPFAIILYDFSGYFSRLKQKIACKILFEEEQQALTLSGERKEPLAKFALLRRDGLFVLQFFRYYGYNKLIF